MRDVLLGGTAFDFDPGAARAALEIDRPGPPPLICEEDLSGTLHIGLAAGYIARTVAQRIAAAIPEAEIVIFVRAQPTAALSWYVQHLREGGTESAARYLFAAEYRHIGWSRPFLAPRFDFSQIDYRGLIETYDALFGAEHVHVYPYEALARDRPALLARMRAELGLDFDESAIDAQRANDSYARALLPVVRGANLFTARAVPSKWTLIHLPYWYAVRKYLLGRLNRLPLGPRPRPEKVLGPRMLDWIAGRFWESNRWLAERMQTDLRALGYPLDPPAQPAAPPAPPAWRRWMSN
ncbi:MAG TPA: hypothetical protein VFT56_08230 [Sphingomonas sp.]|nr:hypothetical protein [Sphingomonas sp.]